MSYSLAIKDGDLVQKGSELDIVWGIDKLKQDLQLWVLESYGGDRFHPSMGSTLQDMIGGVIDESTRTIIIHEIARVLDNYQKCQVKAYNENPALFSLSEILYSIDDITAKVYYDRVEAMVKVRSAASDEASIVFTQGL